MYGISISQWVKNSTCVMFGISGIFQLGEEKSLCNVSDVYVIFGIFQVGDEKSLYNVCYIWLIPGG